MRQNMTPLSRQHSARPGRPMHKQAGASLIEVMVAFLILSIGLLGLAMLQGKSLRMNTDAYLRSQATLIAAELMESMRANPNGNYGPVAAKPLPCGCTGIARATNDDLIRWYDALATMLPGATGSIEKAGVVYTIKMSWQERDLTVKQQWILNL